MTASFLNGAQFSTGTNTNYQDGGIKIKELTMHIKHITISNFRSFRDQPQIESFSPGLNSVIGRNGSGKSNLFDAVQFCLLAPRFANLRQVCICCTLWSIILTVMTSKYLFA